MQAGVDGLLRDQTRPSCIPPLSPETTGQVIAVTLSDPPGETTHWTAAAMAKVSGISVNSVPRIWRAHGLQPHRTRQFKLSTDPKFAEKLRDVVGLCVDLPAHAVVLSVDEKSQIHALDRTPLESLKAHVLTFVSAYNFASISRRSGGRPRSKPSATPGRQHQKSSNSTRVTSSRDQTPSDTARNVARDANPMGLLALIASATQTADQDSSQTTNSGPGHYNDGFFGHQAMVGLREWAAGSGVRLTIRRRTRSGSAPCIEEVTAQAP